MVAGTKRRRLPLASTAKQTPAEQTLKQFASPKDGPGRWSWVGTEIERPNDISRSHTLAAYGFTSQSGFSICPNKFPARQSAAQTAVPQSELNEEEIIVISDDEATPICSKKNCKGNPRCLNYMGQDVWENPAKVKGVLRKLGRQGEDPHLNSREPDLPVGLKDSPIFQLQVTFAALQSSKEGVFNPSKLVESLQLRTSEQQDAQEFSKLFMSHLDAEFKKQADPAVRMLIESQFQGSQVYGTFCHACQYKSERTSDFLEVEINLDGPSRLEDRISASLEPEVLSGDNQYHCPQCSSLQDATRYTELRQLPPVLHFSLLRFVYNLETMERKKQKHPITFPTILDMSRFLGGQQSGNMSDGTSIARQGDSIYELRGVLLHKGASAYHGHYEAQVYDTELSTWFQFNDETVTKVSSLAERPKGGKELAEAPTEKRPKGRPKKRRRIEDSGDESQSPAKELQTTPEPQVISSKDAYMLVYAKKGHSKGCLPREPPETARQAIDSLNIAHENKCEEYERQKDSMKAIFEERLRSVQAIYNTWQTTEGAEDGIVVSEQALRGWLSESWYADIASASPSSPLAYTKRSISNAGVLCEHNKLCPNKAADMKVISPGAYGQITSNTFCDFDPLLTVADICDTCVAHEFNERFYELRHGLLVKQFEHLEQIQDGDQDDGFWISKHWLKDWKLTKPRMHAYSEEDPAPDAPNFYGDVLCEHGAVLPSPSHRRKIGKAAKDLLSSIFPSWQPPSSLSETCAVCEAQASISKEDKRELRKKAEEEKSKLKYMNSMTYSFFSGASQSSCAIIPTTFYKAWKRWVDSPTSQPRPEAVDNSRFLCDSHSLLIYDPNCADEIESTITIIRRDEWDELAQLYPASPLIALNKDDDGKYEPHPPICSECRMARQMFWDVTDIVVQLGPGPGKDGTDHASRSKGASSIRHSRRLRKKQGDRRSITVRKATSVKEMKVQISELFEIPTICQKLFLHGTELEDNEATAKSLDLLANDVLELRQMTEEIDVDGLSDSETGRNKPRDEGRGFNGTVLGGGGWTTDSSMPSSRATSPDHAMHIDEKACQACTFANASHAVSCVICDTILE
ncbi:hypothetical protein NMY22_g2917 [Coprinellus aureogranulatus]|nr:hypothetical protein NMY22_g2917 [Coprinellus aureogranulatus]